MAIRIPISNGTCYSAPGVPLASRYIPCGNEIDGHITCCESSDMCLSSQACFNGQYYVTYLAGCTDPTYQDTSCPDKGIYSNHSWAGLVYCFDDPQDEWMACDDTQSLVTVGAACSCPTTSRTVAFHDTNPLTNIVSLPASIGDPLTLLSGWTGLVSSGPAPTTTSVQSSITLNSISSEATPTSTSTSSRSLTRTSLISSNFITNPVASQTTYATVTPTNTPSNSHTTGTWIGVGIGAGGGTMIVLIMIWFLIKAWRERYRRQFPSIEDQIRPRSQTGSIQSPTNSEKNEADLKSPSWSGHKSELSADETSVSSPKSVDRVKHESVEIDGRLRNSQFPHTGRQLPYPRPMVREGVYEMPA